MSQVFTAFKFVGLAGAPVVHGMSGRVVSASLDGNVGYVRDAHPDAVGTNRAAFLTELGIDLADLTLARQTHSATVAVVNAVDRGRGGPPEFDGFPNTDALVTDVPGVALAITVADCVPLLLYDPVRHVLGVVHAGWRGTVAGIAGAAVAALHESYGSSAADVWAGVGPSIGPCCYEVGDEVIDAWLAAGVEDAESAIVPGDRDRRHLDLWTANVMQLTAAGVTSAHTEVAHCCVRCDAETFFSHRAAMTGAAQRGLMMLVAQLQPRP